MKTLHYSFAQIEAFATIAETGSLSRAIRLKTGPRCAICWIIWKMRWDMRCSCAKGVACVNRRRGTAVSPGASAAAPGAGFESLRKRCRAPRGRRCVWCTIPLCRDFSARWQIPCPTADPNELLERIASRSRAGAGDGQADLAICQANNRTLGSEMEWRALGTVDLRFYAAERLFADCARPLTLLNLSLTPQLVMHRRADDQIARRVQISGHTLYMNEKRYCAMRWSRGRGGDFTGPFSAATGKGWRRSRPKSVPRG
jgi:hypothetical protein